MEEGGDFDAEYTGFFGGYFWCWRGGWGLWYVYFFHSLSLGVFWVVLLLGGSGEWWGFVWVTRDGQ